MRQEFQFGGLFNSLAENLTPADRAWASSNCVVERGIIEARPGYLLFGARSGAHANDIGWGMGYGRYSGDEIQIIRVTSGTVTGGTWKITFSGQQTASIDWDATASEIQNALENLSNVLIGDVLVEGGPLADDTIRITFKGQYANTNVSLISLASGSLTGSGSIVLTPDTEVQGGLSEEYLAAVQKNGDTTVTLYSVDPTTGTYTSVLTGLHASDWFFEQYGDTIYGVNATDGMISKKVATTAGLTSTRPDAPAFSPDATIQGNTAGFVSTSGLSYGNYTGFGSNPTPVTAGSGTVVLTLNANISAGTDVSMEYQWAADQDYSLNDLWRVDITANKPTNLDNTQHLNTSIKFIDNAANVIEPGEYGTVIAGALGRYIHWQGAERAKRKITRKIRISFRVDVNLSSGDTISIQPIKGRQWPNNSVPIDVDQAPIAASIDYAYSYKDLASGLESDLSPVKTSGSLPSTSPKWGANVLLEGDVSPTLTNTDLLYLYRREKATGIMRRLPNIDGTYGVLNTGTPQLTDTYLESELSGFPQFGGGQTGLSASQLSGTAVQICTWKQTLTVAGRKQVWVSWIGRPKQFEPSPDEVGATFAPDDEESAGRTDYVADDRSEDVFGIHGQDPLYAISEFSAYAMVGDSPATAVNFRRLPGSRGTVGTRASYPLGGGVEVASQDGLYYYSVGRTFQGDDNGAMIEREETREVRKSWETLAPASGCVVVEHQDQIWVFQGANYLLNTRSRRWTAGTFADSVKAAISNRVRGLKFMDSKGRLFTIDKSYTTDNGTAISWYYETGWFDTPRSAAKMFEIRGSGAVTLKVYSFDGANSVTSPLTFTRPSGSIFVPKFSVPPAFRYKYRFEGASASVTVENAAVHLEAAPMGANN